MANEATTKWLSQAVIEQRINLMQQNRERALQAFRDAEAAIRAIDCALGELRDLYSRAASRPGCTICHDNAANCTSDHK